MKISLLEATVLAALVTATTASILPRQDDPSSVPADPSAAPTDAAPAPSSAPVDPPADPAASSAALPSSTAADATATSADNATAPVVSASAAPSPSPALPPYGAANLSSFANDTVQGPNGLNNADCRNLTVQVPVQAQNIQFEGLDQQYSNQSYITGTLLRLANLQEPFLATHSNGTFLNDNTYNISATYCTPRQGGSDNGSLITAVHGIGFNKDYWNFGLSPEYSFVEQAASYGYSTFTYDRLGTGGSSTTENGINEPQAATEVSILANILGQLRNGTLIEDRQFERIVGVGHSYGSIQMQAITATAPELLQGVVLTGYSSSTAGVSQFLLASNLVPAQQVFPDRLGDKPPVWLATASNVGDISNFMWPPNYSEEAASLARENVDAVTLGALVSLSSVTQPAANFTGPVFVISGQRDLPFCAGDCTTEGKIDGVQMLYPQTSNFTSSIVPETGHGLVPHYTGPDSQRQILEFIIANDL